MRNNHSTKQLIINGTNAAASGIFQAPNGFVQGDADGDPISAKEQAYVLENNYGFSISMN